MVVVSALDATFGIIGWGVDWYDVLGAAGMGVFGLVLYFLIRRLDRLIRVADR
jgi:hypothetical protein